MANVKNRMSISLSGARACTFACLSPVAEERQLDDATGDETARIDGH